MKKENKLTLALATAVFFCSFSGSVFAQGPALIGQGSGKGESKEKHSSWKKEDLLRLKKENPEEFKNIIQEKREQIRERLEYLKQDNPQRYHKLMQRVRLARIKSLRKLKKEDPEKFVQVMQERRANIRERLQSLKAKDPQKYARIVRSIEKIKNLNRLRKENPGKFKEYLRSHPELRQRLENIKDRLGKQQNVL